MSIYFRRDFDRTISHVRDREIFNRYDDRRDVTLGHPVYIFAVAPLPYRPDTARFNEFLPGKVLGAFCVYWHTRAHARTYICVTYICFNAAAREDTLANSRSRKVFAPCMNHARFGAGFGGT